jgi:hypothetical protein
MEHLNVKRMVQACIGTLFSNTQITQAGRAYERGDWKLVFKHGFLSSREPPPPVAGANGKLPVSDMLMHKIVPWNSAVTALIQSHDRVGFFSTAELRPGRCAPGDIQDLDLMGKSGVARKLH